MLGSLKVKIKVKGREAEAKAWFSSKRFTEDKAMDVLMCDDSSGTLKVLIVDDQNELQYLDIAKVEPVSFVSLNDTMQELFSKAQVPQVAKPAKSAKQTTSEETIAGVAS